MHSHRRPRGKILFESLCAVTIGVSFVGAWFQTGAWAFLGPAFLFTLFGLYWSFDLFGREPAADAAEPAVATAALGEAEPEQPAPAAPRGIEILAIEEFVAAGPEAAEAEPIEEAPLAAFAAEPEPMAKPKPKRRSKKSAGEATVAAPPAGEPAPAAFDESVHHESHIEQLFDPQPFARQVRPAFGRRSRGPGPRPLPA